MTTSEPSIPESASIPPGSMEYPPCRCPRCAPDTRTTPSTKVREANDRRRYEHPEPFTYDPARP